MKRLLIDAVHPEDMRLAVVQDHEIINFDISTSSKKKIKGNIYLAQVVRIEPALQAAFVEFGDDRQGFVPLSEIHSAYSGCENVRDYFEKIEDYQDKDKYRHLKVQNILKRKQYLIVQAIKEERGIKGATLSTYLSIPGRYCILMPNTTGGGVSKRIQDIEDRKRLKDIVKDLELPSHHSLIIRSAGENKTEREIKKDYGYVSDLWKQIKNSALSMAELGLIYEEVDLIKRAIRDVYQKDMEEVLVEGEEAYQKAHRFMKTISPTHASKIKKYHDNVPLFEKFHLEDQVNAMLSPKVDLPSGGSIVIAQTEALVAIDVNSGRATRERNINDTALKTNLEAVSEIAKQLRLRDLSGIIVIDFIDMEDAKDIAVVEKAMKDATKEDKAKLQIAKISQFGLMEMCRQRMRSSLLESHTTSCHHCHGQGVMRSTESSAVYILRSLEKKLIERKELILNTTVKLFVKPHVDVFLLNYKRTIIYKLEERYQFKLLILADQHLISDLYHIEWEEHDAIPVVSSPPQQPKPLRQKPHHAIHIPEKKKSWLLKLLGR